MRMRWCCLLLMMVALGGCSPLQVTPSSDLHALVTGQGYELMVRSTQPGMNRELYEMAAQSLGSVLPLADKEPFSGSVQVDFAAVQPVASNAYSGGTYGGATATTTGVTAGWYSGASPTTAGVPSGAGGARTYFNGVLKVAVKDAAGKVLWSAEYDHKGRWSLQSETPEAVAKASLDRIAQALRMAVAAERPAAQPKGAQ